jgi:ABC-type lipoprotein release transport system permease subunit
MNPLSITARFAVRNLSRNFRRTLLSTLGVAVGCSIALVDIGLQKGKVDMFIRNIAEGGMGHLQVVPEGWLVSRDDKLRLAGWEKVLGQLRSNPEVETAAPRARIQGMLAMGTRLIGAEITGVDPATEPRALRYVRTMAAGRYLKPGDRHEMVIGKTIADHLGISTGDQVIVTVVDNTGATNSDMFEIAGTVDLGGQLDAQVCQVTLDDLAALSGIPGAGEIAVILKDGGRAGAVRDRIRAGLPSGDTAWTWAQMEPQTEVAVRMNYVVAAIISAILVFIVFLGIASAQLTAVLERKRELAVLSALGMGRASILKLVLSEALALGTASFLATLALAGPFTLYFAKVGIVFLEPGQTMSMAGTVIDPVFHGAFGPWFFTDALILCFTATILASLYPAWYAIRLDPAEALRVS